MKKSLLSIGFLCVFSGMIYAQKEVTTVKLHPEEAKQTISKHIYGQFSEHLGRCIYGGLWVGEESDIPNVKGYRKDVLEALKALHIPNLRWPGGCFADEYHWMDGVGPKENRPKMVNNNWGGVVEDNSFGTHEFLNLCELLGCEPYVSMNVGSGTVEETAKWIEYMTSEGESPMANWRRENGREKAWKVKFIGIGNESWGCGGDMHPEYYADVFRRYGVYCREFNGNKLFKIACGASDYDYKWTETLMNKAGGKMNGLSLHYYTVANWNSKGSAREFSLNDYYWTIGKAVEIEEVLQKHMAIMDKYDADKRVGLMVDEWGTWFDVEPGTNPGFLFQQNTIRDAMVAARTLNIFHKYADRIKMANIAQVVNVLQAMILTDNEKMVLTPTYHVFHMYQVHQDARFIPASIEAPSMSIRDKAVATVDVTASQDSTGLTHLSLVNIDAENVQKVEIDLNGLSATHVTGSILTSEKINNCNTFDQPNLIAPKAFKTNKPKNGKLTVTLPAMSIVTLTVD